MMFVQHQPWRFVVLSSRHQSLTAITKPQFAIGPQKCVVRTPVGEFQIAWALLARLLACFVAHMPAVTAKQPWSGATIWLGIHEWPVV